MNGLTHIGGGVHYIGRNYFDPKISIHSINCRWDGEKSIFNSDNNSKLHRISSLGFENTKGYYTASGVIWSNRDNVRVDFNFCDCTYTTVNVGQTKKFFKATSDVKYYADTTGSEENPSDKTTGYNGFLDLEGFSDPEIEVYIEDLKVERGRTPTTWTPSLETGEIGWIKPNLVSGTSRIWDSWLTTEDQNNYSRYFFGDFSTDEKDLLVYAKPGEILTAMVELWFNSNLTFTSDFSKISTSGAVNGDWDWDLMLQNNPFTNMVNLNSNPAGEVIRFQKSVVLTEEVRKLKAQVRFDYAPGSFRYRVVGVKKGKIWGPMVWCLSDIDMSNPNLIEELNKDITQSTSTTTNTLEEIEILDPPQGNINSGYKVHVGDNGWCGLYTTPPIRNFHKDDQDSSFTISSYVRGKGIYYYQVQITMVDGNSKLWSRDNGDTSDYSRLISFTIDSKEWERYNFTVNFETLKKAYESDINSDRLVNTVNESIVLNTIRPAYFQRGSDMEVCGIKLEEGNKVTAYVPYS